MATHESFHEPQNPLKYKKLVLRVSIDCEGCRKRVNKILSKVPGVHEIDIDIKKQNVTVTGDVDAFVLLKKLRKSGRQVELLPEMKPETVTSKRPEKTKDKGKQPTVDNNEVHCRNIVGCNNDGILPGKMPQQRVKAPSPEEHATNSKTTGSGGAGSSAKSGGKNDSTSVSEVSKESKISDPEKESKSEGKKPEKCTADGVPPMVAEDKDGDGDGDNSTTEKVLSDSVGKKKKKGGHYGNKDKVLSSSVSYDVATDHGVAVPPIYSLPANHIHPRDYDYYGYPPDVYTSSPIYDASYNTSHASSSSTTSYYAQLPADSYVYAYNGPERQPTPSDLEEYSRQPLDSLEMFSDENPNGCLIM